MSLKVDKKFQYKCGISGYTFNTRYVGVMCQCIISVGSGKDQSSQI